MVQIITETNAIKMAQNLHTQRHSQATADGLISWDKELTVESGWPAFFLSRSVILSVLPPGLPALSTLRLTAGIQPINRKITSCLAWKLLTLHDRGLDLK